VIWMNVDSKKQSEKLKEKIKDEKEN